MTISERFKQELQAGNFETAIELALSEAMNLEIVTWVADDAEEGEDNPKRQRGSQIRTKINLLDGKVENQIGSLFLDGGPYANLREFHTHQIQAGQELVRHKFESLQSLWNACVAAKSEMEAAAATSPAPAAPQLPENRYEPEQHASTGVEPASALPAMPPPADPEPAALPTPEPPSFIPAIQPESELDDILTANQAFISPESGIPSLPVIDLEIDLEDEDDTPTAFEPFLLETVNPNIPETAQQNGHSHHNGFTEHPETITDPEAITAAVNSNSDDASGFHSIESILSNLFSPSAEPNLHPPAQEVKPTDNHPSNHHQTAPAPPPLALAEPITPESVNLQIELSIDELLADLFYEDDDTWQAHANAKKNGTAPQVPLPVSDPWSSKTNTVPDLNSFADNAPEPPKLSFDR